MKHIAMALVLLFTAASLFAGDGKSCNVNKTAAKNVELTGTLEGKTFRVADSDKSFTVCEKTKSAVLKLGENGGSNVKIKGKLVSCEGEGEELVIEEAKKI